MKRWSRYIPGSAVSKRDAHNIVTSLSKSFRVRRPTMIFVTYMPDALGDYLWPNCYVMRVLSNKRLKNKALLHVVCHEFAHHLDYMRRGKTNHGDIFRNLLSKVYDRAERICGAL